MTRSPRRLRRQVQDTVEEQVRDLPLHAVRLAMFGVGRALLISDRVTRDYKQMRAEGVAPVLQRLREDAQHSAVRAGEAVGRAVDRVRGAEPAPGRHARATAEPEISVAKPPGTRRAEPKSPAEPQTPAGPEPAAAGPAAPKVSAAESLPVPDYDNATLPQLRARLRGLSVEQVQSLRDYEREHAGRPDVLKMYDNRIAKLNGVNG